MLDNLLEPRAKSADSAEIYRYQFVNKHVYIYIYIVYMCVCVYAFKTFVKICFFKHIEFLFILLISYITSMLSCFVEVKNCVFVVEVGMLNTFYNCEETSNLTFCMDFIKVALGKQERVMGSKAINLGPR